MYNKLTKFILIMANLTVFSGCGDVDDPQEQSIYLEDDSNFSSVDLALSSVGNGFYYPIDGTSGDANWLACGSSYSANVRHLGTDISASETTPVFAVGDGTVVSISGPNVSSGWGSGNYAVAIRHESTAGTFIAIYGHIRNLTVSENSDNNTVTPGQQLGTIGPYYNGSHLHFGIRPGSSVPSTNWGRISDSGCNSPNNTNGFVAPITYIEANSPLGNVSWTQISVNTTYSDSVGNHLENYYKFTKISGKTYTITLHPTTGDPDLFGSYIESFTRSNSQYSSTRGSGSDDVISFTASSSGSYYLIVYGYSTANYTLRVAESGNTGSCHSGSNGGSSYCSTSCRCGVGEGDCDSNSECQNGLFCARDVGANYGVNPSYDFCEEFGGK